MKTNVHFLKHVLLIDVAVQMWSFICIDLAQRTRLWLNRTEDISEKQICIIH